MICFDTMVVIWGVQGTASTTQEPMIRKTKHYIHYLSTQKKRIFIPAPVLFEYLTGFPEKESRVQRDLIEKAFFVPSFDLPAAALAADLLRNRQLVKDIQQQHGLHRESLKTDAEILAVAITNRAEKVISTDPYMPQLAQGRIPVEAVPDIDNQLGLFDS